ncbi:LEPR-XLL domain-containing protein [Parasediminibacterium sp. JCM 36343]
MRLLLSADPALFSATSQIPTL